MVSWPQHHTQISAAKRILCIDGIKKNHVRIINRRRDNRYEINTQGHSDHVDLLLMHVCDTFWAQKSIHYIHLKEELKELFHQIFHYSAFLAYIYCDVHTFDNSERYFDTSFVF